ncbi:Flp pilus assembly complex ATPase component TadA [bacterium]|nr:Flp pilus assembly complex ATPase component TadA [bacterium]
MAMRSLPRQDHRPVGEIVREISSATVEQVENAVKLAHATGRRTAEVLVNTGVITPEERQRSLAKQFGRPFVDLRDFQYDPNAINAVEAYLLKQHKVIPLSLEGRKLTIAISDPLNVRAKDDISAYTGYEVEDVFAVGEEIMDALDRFLGLAVSQQAGEDLGMAMEQAENDIQSTVASKTSDQGGRDEIQYDEATPVIVKLVYIIIIEAINAGASDIHIQPEEDCLRVRFREDGILRDAEKHRHSWLYGRAIIARLKVMAAMDIAEKRRPQDGRVSVSYAGQAYDLRVSCLPGIHGEKVVMRIAEQSTTQIGLHKLGFAEEQLRRFEEVVARPYGMLLVTGPTGSGKTTTLYSVLNRLSVPEKNVITIEDPVEKRLAGLTQVEVRSDAKAPLSFASALRSVLRQDPDIVMVGEVRDRETALLATEASLTGHLVLSTLHTNNAAGSPPRLLDMGIEPFLVSSSLIGVLAQRLVRVLCPKCKEAYELAPDQLESLSVSVGDISGRVTAYRPVGCSACGGRGYRGRAGVFELLVVTEQTRRLIIDRAPGNEIGRVAREQGMVTMLEDAVAKVLQGITTVQEALRVVDVESD